jgi:VanZ family protein
MQGVIRLICIGYAAFLTFLLLTADPLWWIGMRAGLPQLVSMFFQAAHASSFFMLAVLALAARWPAPRWMIVALLVAYAGATEVAQIFLPPRTAEWQDWILDLVGIAVGAGACWTVALISGALTHLRHPTPEFAALQPPDQWNAVRNAMSRPADRGQSWWG